MTLFRPLLAASGLGGILYDHWWVPKLAALRPVSVCNVAIQGETLRQLEREESEAAGRESTARNERRAVLLLTAVSILLGVTWLVRGTAEVHTIQDSDLANFFLKSATYVANGDPLHMYSVRSTLPNATYPNYNPPLSAFLLAPMVRLAQVLHIRSMHGRIIFVALPFVALIPLLGYVALMTLRFLRPEVSASRQLWLLTLVLLSPLSWQSLSKWYHVEQPVMLCFLLGAIIALQSRKAAIAGVLAGLAVLSRTTAVVPLLALGVLLVMNREWLTLLKFAGISVLLTATALTPFFVVNRADTVYSLVIWRGTAPIGRSSLWALFAYSGQTNELRHAIDAAMRPLDFYAVILVVVVTACLAAWRLAITAYGTETWAVVAVAALAVPFLSKTVWPYYYLEPFVFIVIWEMASISEQCSELWRWPFLTVSYLAAATTLAQYMSLHSVGTLDRVAVGLVQSGAMLGFVLLVCARLKSLQGLEQAPTSA